MNPQKLTDDILRPMARGSLLPTRGFRHVLLTFALRQQVRAPGSVRLAVAVGAAGELIAGLAAVDSRYFYRYIVDTL